MLIRHAVRSLLAIMSLLPLLVSAAQAPDFRLPTQKSSVTLSSYTGKIVYVDFWASWCGPCRKSFPWMGELQRRYKKDLKVIAINLDEERDEALAFLKKYPPGFTVAFDPQGKVAEVYGVPGMPTSYLIDPAGKIVTKHIGFRSKDKSAIESDIQSLIAKKRKRAR